MPAPRFQSRFTPTELSSTSSFGPIAVIVDDELVAENIDVVDEFEDMAVAPAMRSALSTKLPRIGAGVIVGGIGAKGAGAGACMGG